MKIRKGDLVQIVTGAGKGQQGRVVHADSDRSQVVVQNQNYIWKHVRRTQKNPQGGRLQKEAPIHVSNVRVVCPACAELTRLKSGVSEEGARVRVCRKCNEEVS